jgi:hypothetical protein
MTARGAVLAAVVTLQAYGSAEAQGPTASDPRIASSFGSFV